MTEIKKGIKEDFLEQLYVDYGTRKKNSIIYEFYRRENERYLQEVLEQPGKIEKNGLKALLYAEYRFRKKELDCYDYLKEIFSNLGGNSTLYRALITRPHYQREEEHLDGKEREGLSKHDWKRVQQLVGPYLMIFLEQEKMEVEKLNKSTLQAALLEMAERMEQEDLRERLASEGIDEKEVERLYDFVMDRYLHAAVGRHFYDSGFRAKRVDKTLQLLELFCQKKGIGSLSEGSGQGASREQALTLFKLLVKRGRESGDGAGCYQNLFVPLFIDEVTGISLCVVGKEHYEAYISRVKSGYLRGLYQKSTFPCALAVLNFMDFSRNEFIPLQITYESERDFTYRQHRNKTDAERDPEEYFELMYGEYLTAVEDGKQLMRDINELEEVPEEIYGFPSYQGYFSSGGGPETEDLLECGV